MAAVMVSKGRWNPCERIGFGLAKGSFSPLTFQRIGSGDGVEEEEELVHPHQVSTRFLGEIGREKCVNQPLLRVINLVEER